MIARSLRILLDGLIDYSGFAPPAGLPMGKAVENFAEYGAGANSWMLGRSIIPLAKITEYESALAGLDGRETKTPWMLSALTTGDVAGDRAVIKAFNARHANHARIDAVELKADSPDVIRSLRPIVPAGLRAYVEIPLTGDLPALTAALAANGLRGKARTGGLTADSIPSCDQIARFIVACRAARLPFKFTAGMHAPFRSVRRLTYAADSPSTQLHGFINAFVAATLAWADGDLRSVTAVLAEADPLAFQFDDERALVHDHRLAAEQIAAGRKFAVSLGSCSFVEPVESLPSINQF